MESNNNLNQIEGIKIREQYFEAWLQFGLDCLLMCIIVSLGVYIKHYDLFLRFIIYFDVIISIYVIIIYLINILNRKFFGKIVLVICDEGIYSLKKIWAWEKIRNIRYDIRIPSMPGPRAGKKIRELYINNIYLVTSEYKIKCLKLPRYDFPLYGFEILKKYVKNNKNIEISDKGWKFEIFEKIFCAFLAILIVIII